VSIDLFDLYNRFCSDVNTFQGGFVRPERDYERLVNSISQDIWNEWTEQAEKTQEINDNLSPYLQTVQIIVAPASGNEGIALYPKDYGRYSASRVLLHKGECMCDTSIDTYDGGKCVREGHRETEIEKADRIKKYRKGIVQATCYKVESSRWASILTHETKCPTLLEPAITQFKNGIKVAPLDVSVIVLDYFIAPKYAKFAYTIAPGNPQTGAGDYIIYDQANSGKLEWPDTMIPFFLDKLREVYARYTRDGALFQMSKKSA
jgi:hypothetical protein